MVLLGLVNCALRVCGRYGTYELRDDTLAGVLHDDGYATAITVTNATVILSEAVRMWMSMDMWKRDNCGRDS
jgi:hypothetical protein